MVRKNRYTLGKPPRFIPLSLKTYLLFGGFLNQFGWFFFGFGMIFFWIFALNSDITSWFYFRNNIEVTRGAVLFSEDTGASVGGSRSRTGRYSRGTPIVAIHYSFKVNNRSYNGVSYATGEYLAPKTSVTIEYKKDNPNISRIKGMRTKIFGPGPIFVIIFPIIGLCFIFAGLKRGIKSIDLLQSGRVAKARFVSKKPTNMKVNKQPVYELTFEFEDNFGKKHHYKTKTHILESILDEEFEQLVYSPYNPEYACLIDELPGLPIITPSGNIKLKSPKMAINSLILPVISILGHGGYFLIKLFS